MFAKMGDVFPDQLTEPGPGGCLVSGTKTGHPFGMFWRIQEKKGLSLGNFINLFRGSDVDLWGSARWSFFTWWLPEKNNINTDFHWRRALNGRYTSKLKLHHAYIIDPMTLCGSILDKFSPWNGSSIADSLQNWPLQQIRPSLKGWKRKSLGGDSLPEKIHQNKFLRSFFKRELAPGRRDLLYSPAKSSLPIIVSGIKC